MRPHTVAGLALVVVTLGTWWWVDGSDDGADGGAGPAPAGTTVVVRHVIDGDTFVTGDDERVRVIGFDAPEAGGYRPVECGGREASEAARRLLEGRTVTLTSDPTQAERDRFDRLLAHVELPDGRDLGEVMLREGHAEVYRAAGRFEGRDAYDAAQSAARRDGVGLWGRCRG